MSQYQLEPLKDCIDEIIPILRNEHWAEVGHYKDIPIDMDWDRYHILQAMNKLKCYTIRSPINEEFKESILQGYAFFIIDKHLHYKTILVANQDILYIREPYRGIGRSFLKWCDDQHRILGVKTGTHHVKPWFDWSPMAEEIGYEFAEKIMTRRLD